MNDAELLAKILIPLVVTIVSSNGILLTVIRWLIKRNVNGNGKVHDSPCPALLEMRSDMKIMKRLNAEHVRKSRNVERLLIQLVGGKHGHGVSNDIVDLSIGGKSTE